MARNSTLENDDTQLKHRKYLSHDLPGAKSKALKKWETCLSTTFRGGIMARIWSLGKQVALLERRDILAGAGG